MKAAVLMVLGLAALVLARERGRLSTDTLCPLHCSCNYGGEGGVVAECERITSTQLFDDQLGAFFMQKNTDENKLKLEKRLFANMQMDSINSITIVNVDISSINVEAFQDLNYLKVLNLTNNDIRFLDPETFAKNGDLELLSLSNNPLKISQDPGSFILNSTSLADLDVSFCRLNSLPASTFSKLPGLTYLNLASNNLTKIDPALFADLLNLEDLYLSDNNIESLDLQVFNDNQNLNNLVLKGNRLTTIEGISIPGLLKIDLSYCMFTKLNSKSFEGIPDILLLNLTGNELTNVDVSAFSPLVKLNYLDISNNNLRGPLNEDTFMHNQEIEKISLQDNPLMQQLPVDGFKGGFANFYMLDASNCGLHSLSPNVFQSMSDMARLYLSGNSLQNIPLIPDKLNVLHLSNNKISSIDNINIPEKSQLRQLLLDGNEIKSLSQKNFANLPLLKKLDVSSCDMENIWSTLKDGSFQLPSLTELRLSNNQLKKISQEELEVFTELEYLDILSNPFVCDENFQDTIDYLIDSDVEPIRSENSLDNDEKFTWRSVLKANNCSPRSQKIQIEIVSSPKPVSTTEEVEDDMNDDDDDDYDDEEDDIEGTDDLNEPGIRIEIDKKFDPHGGIPTMLNISPASYQVIVLVTVAFATFIVIILLAVILKVCKQRLAHQRGPQHRGKRGSLSYRPLYNNEHINSPTTPICRAKNDVLHEEEMENVVYRQTVGPVSYVGNSYQHNYREKMNKMSI